MIVKFLAISFSFLTSWLPVNIGLGQQTEIPNAPSQGIMSAGIKIYENGVDPFEQMFAALLNQKKTRDALEIVDFQIEKLALLQKERRPWWDEEMAKLQKKHGSTPTIQEAQEMDRQSEAIIRQRVRKRVEEILLPHQIKRLDELSAQEVKKRNGTRGLLSTDWLKSKLEISDEQSKRIAERVKKEQENFTKQIAELKKRAEDNVLQELTAKQQRMYRELVGSSSDEPER